MEWLVLYTFWPPPGYFAEAGSNEVANRWNISYTNGLMIANAIR